jgi:hypothetical protein
MPTWGTRQGVKKIEGAFATSSRLNDLRRSKVSSSDADSNIYYELPVLADVVDTTKEVGVSPIAPWTLPLSPRFHHVETSGKEFR